MLAEQIVAASDICRHFMKRLVLDIGGRVSAGCI